MQWIEPNKICRMFINTGEKKGFFHLKLLSKVAGLLMEEDIKE